MNGATLAALVRHAAARLEALDPDRAADARAELLLGLVLAEALGRGLVREVTHAGRAALTFTYGRLCDALAEAEAIARLTEIEEEQQ
jgi:hypothetical protein